MKPMQILQSPSKNYFKGRSGYKPELIVVHCTDGAFPGDLNWLKGGGTSQVSSHYLVAPSGEVYQLVQDEDVAWHAGVVVEPSARLLKPGVNPNLYTIGIETSLRPNARMTEAQECALKELVKLVAERHGIPLDRDHVIGHKEIRATKSCPGTISVDKLVMELQSPPDVPSNMVDKETFKRTIINFIKTL